MIVSHRHRFIFLKTRKTASTSVEIALSRHCGADDVVTPISEEDEVLRRESGGVGPQHYEEGDDRPLAYNHMSAWRVRQLVGDDVWRSYYKFTTERNPWDAVVSLYCWRHRDKPAVPFSDFVQFDAPSGIRKLARNARIYRIDDNIGVDKVCLYESLADDLEAVWKHLELPLPVGLPSAKGGFRRREQRDYRDWYAPADVERVRELFEPTITEFGYEF